PFPYTTLFRSRGRERKREGDTRHRGIREVATGDLERRDLVRAGEHPGPPLHRNSIARRPFPPAGQQGWRAVAEHPLVPQRPKGCPVGRSRSWLRVRE